MDMTFKCPACEQELEVDSSGAGSEIECPACGETILIPQPSPEFLAEQQQHQAAAGFNPIDTSAARKEEKHFKVPDHAGPAAILIKKASKPLEFAAKESDRLLRIKTIRRSECQEFGKDKYDEMVSDILQKIGELNIIAIHPLTYSHIDPVSQKLMQDYGLLIYFRG
jgi:DNA-directed RNA polymerase subunit RPC12/RpoP